MTKAGDSTYWNQMYIGMNSETVVYDLWLDKYADVLDLARQLPILDLGCGAGNDTLYLVERGYRVIACDYSEEALQHVRVRVPEAQTLVLDLTERLPFADASTHVIIADLSLHYFPWEQTLAILSEIRRVLRPGGTLLCRVNSTRDTAYGAGQGELLEPNYYLWQGQRKRFFDRESLERLFTGWQLLSMEEQELLRYEKPKIVWELAVAVNRDENVDRHIQQIERNKQAYRARG